MKFKNISLIKDENITNILLSKFNNSNNDAYEFIFKSFYNRLCYFANNIINNEAVSQDIVQDVFVKLWQRNNNFETYDQLSAFLYVSVKNSCLNFLKQKRNCTIDLESLTKDEIQINNDDLITENIISSEVLSVINEAIETLPCECAKIMTLIMKGYSMVEISLILNLASSSVRAQKARAIKLLKIKIPRKMFIILLVLAK